MLIGIPLETAAGETRVAVTPETAKKPKAQGHTLRIQSGAGVAASANDAGHKAVMMAADKYQHFFPILMTAAGGGASAPNT